MKLYLSSYGIGNKKEELKKWIAKNDNKICLIANSKDAYPKGKRKTFEMQKDTKELEEIGFDVSILDLKKYFKNSNGLREYLKDFHMFYVVGGNTFVLRKAMKLSGFDSYLKEISTDPNYLYIGYSAGICVLARDMKGIVIMDKPEVDPYNYGTPIYEGIGLLDYIPIPHYQSNHFEAKLANDCVKYCEENRIKYKTLKDGEVIIENIKEKI